MKRAVWSVADVAYELDVSVEWVYRNWRKVGLKKINSLRLLRFTNSSVTKLLNGD